MIRRVLHGIIRGKTIELLDHVDFVDGQHVEIELRGVASAAGDQSGKGFQRTEGALEDDQEWDGIMAEIEQSRKQERGSQWAEE
jgi:hypothetical protein